MLGIIGAGSIPALSIMNSSGGPSRISIAVRESQYIYAQFGNVSGRIAQDGSSGVPIDRIKLLDTLIESLRRAKRFDALQGAKSAFDSPERIDAMIDTYAKEIKTLAAKASPYMAPAPLPSGVAVNVAA